MLKIGIVGLPNVGKSTLFNSLTKKGVPAENYPFCTIDPSVGVVAVSDSRLTKLRELSCSAKVVPAAVEFVDIAGLVKGAAEGEGLGNQFLAHLREVNAILHLARAFRDDSIVHVGGRVDPLTDIETVNQELRLADEQMLERRLSRGKEKNLPALPLLATKPMIYVFNRRGGAGDVPLDFTAGLNAPFLDLNAATGEGLEKLIRASYDLLGLISFFTTGPDETRAWTVKKGVRAPEAGAAIHTDFEKKFIRALVVSYTDLMSCGSLAACRERGLLRTEGRDYIVVDGDVMEFKI